MKKVFFIFLSLSVAIITFMGLLFYTNYVKKNPQAISLNFLEKTKPLTSAEKKQKAIVNQLTGSEIEFARHQCDGPRSCPTPDPENANQAIRASTKQPSLKLFPIGGVNPQGIMYYCTSDNHCWGIEDKTNTIVSKKN